MQKRRIYQHNPRPAVRIIIDSLQIGGAETHLSRILPPLVKKGIEIEVITLSEAKINQLSAQLHKHGIKVTHLYWPQKFNVLPKPIAKIVKLTLSSMQIIKSFIQDRHTITHFFLPRSYLLGMTLATLTRLPAPKIMSRRSLNHYQKKKPLARYFETKFHKKTNIILANSQAICNQLHEEEQVAKDKIKLIYNGIEIPQKTQTAPYTLHKALNLAKDTYIITIVANLIPYKGHADLLHACYLFNKQHDINWALLIVGRDDGIGTELQQLANKYNISEKVKLLGARSDVPNILMDSNLGVLCSHQEGFSNAILEAMIYKLPMVVTDVGGNAEAIQNNKCGLVVPPQDPIALSDAILNMYNNPTQAKAFATSAYVRVTTCFSQVKCVEQYESVYEKLISNSINKKVQTHEFN